MLEKTTRVNLLYDFYGNLLTKKQQLFIELYYENNFSLREIADEYNISRQAVFDLINRAVETLEQFERKLQLYKKHITHKEKCFEILSHLEENEKIDKNKIKNIIVDILQL